MNNVDLYAGVGYALELLARSEYHRQFPLKRYLDVEIMPVMGRGQTRYYISQEGIPTGMVTWAWLSQDIETEVHSTGRALADHEWNCGSRLFFNDFITPYGNIRAVIRDLTHNVFADHCATSLRRHPDGSVRGIRRWIGVDHARRMRREVAE